MIGDFAKRKGPFTIAALAGAVAGCTALTGAGDFLETDGAMDSVDGGQNANDASGSATPPSDGGVLWRDAAQEGPPACDEKTDLSCVGLPAGWGLVAVTDLGGGKTPDCPEGFDGAKDAKIDVGESPSARSDTCACDGCKVTEPVTCAGPVTNHYGTGCDFAASTSRYANELLNACHLLPQTGSFSVDQKFTPPQAFGGKCSPSPPSFHASRVNWARRMRLCTEIARCSGGVCDARVDSPFRACIVHEGDVACPDHFPQKSLVGEKAAFDCSGTCSCTVTQSCSGTITHYSDTNCTTGAVVVAVDGVCRATQLGGKFFGAYKVSLSPTGSCSATGAATAWNGRLVSPLTLCCR